MQIRGLIIEGHSHTGKTSLINALKRQLASDTSSERNVIILGEHYSQILNLVHGELKTLSREEHLEVLNQRLDMLHDLSKYAFDMGPASRRSRGIFYILERFHLNHTVHFGSSDELKIVEEKILQLNGRCILLHVEENLEERVTSRSKKEWSGKTSDDVKTYVKDMTNTQTKYINACEDTLVPTYKINTDYKDWDKYAKDILKIMNEED